MQKLSIKCVLGAALLVALVTGEARATDGHFLHGVGAIQSSMGGAGIAAPLDLLGTFYLNPAGLMAFDGTRVDLGFEMFRPDRTVSSAAGPLAGETESKSDFVPIPAFAWSTKLNNEKVVVGLGGMGIGGFGVDYPADPTNPIMAQRPFGFGQVYSNYSLLKISPAIAFAVNDQLWLGFAANVDWAALTVDPMPVAPPDVADPDGTPGTGDESAFFSRATATDGAFGFGFQVGVLFRPNDLVSLGAAFTSPQWFEEFQFNAVFENPNNPATFQTPRDITFKLNIPAVLGGGIAVYPLPNLILAGDFRYLFYDSTEGFDLDDPSLPFNPDGSVSGFGWENIYTIGVGAQFKPHERIALRAGYNRSDQPIPEGLSMINVPAPAVVQDHLTVGAGIAVSRQIGISVAYYHAFSNEVTGPILLPGVPQGSTVTNQLSEDSILLQFSFVTRGSI